MTTATVAEYRAYIADLAAYNGGQLVGEWIDLEDKTSEEIEEEIAELLKKWTADAGELREEYAVHDWEGVPSSFGEYPDWEDVTQFVELIDERGEAWRLFWEHHGGSTEYATSDAFGDAYCGEYKDEEDFAYEDASQMYNLDDMPLSSYIDWESYARDLFMDYWGEYDAVGMFHVFRSC